MPDLGLEIEDFQAQTWRIENWSKQGKRLTGPEFSCGGHKWQVDAAQHSTSSADVPGEYSSFLKATPTDNRTTWSRYTWTTPIPNQHQKDGTRVHNFVWPSQILGNPLSRLLLVGSSTSKSCRTNIRCPSPFRRRRMRLGFHPFRGPSKAIHPGPRERKEQTDD